jgi:hypothetical protein
MKCHHDACTCQVNVAQEYCSPECKSQLRDEGATECHCGHSTCRESNAQDRDSTR